MLISVMLIKKCKSGNKDFILNLYLFIFRRRTYWKTLGNLHKKHGKLYYCPLNYSKAGLFKRKGVIQLKTKNVQMNLVMLFASFVDLKNIFFPFLV